MDSVRQLVEEIDKNRNQIGASQKDEVRVMQTMLNDKDFKVDVYGNSGIEGVYCPFEESRIMIANILKDTAKISTKEAAELSNNYEYGKKESAIMVGLSKEFINTYINTGRKLPLGGRERSNISIVKKEKKAKALSYPKKIGVNEDGTDRYEIVDDGVTPDHISLRVFGGCPSWLKKENE